MKSEEIMSIRKTLLVVIMLVILTSLFADYTRNEARNLVLGQILSEDIGKVDIYEFKSNLTKQKGLDLWDKHINCPYENNWIYFIDDLVFANWEHPCRYIFVDVETGNYQIINEKIHPENFNETTLELISHVERPNTGRILQTNPNAISRNEEPNPHLYAVIINGCD